MSHSVYYADAPSSHVIDLPARRAGPSRRQLVGGFAAVAASLAGLVEFAPDWGSGAPARPTVAPALPPAFAQPFIAPAVPRLIQYSAVVRQEWMAFRERFVTPDGRILDTGNGNASHSEGQGWGLMVAQAADDPQTFATILAWTTQHLQRRPDALHAWRYRPGDPNPVSDMNNATDGDLFIGAALARAAVRWNRPDYAAAAARIGRDILGLVRTAGNRTLLLPAAAGFDKPDAVTVNPSYYAFALFPDLAAVVPSPVWEQLRQDGLALVLEGRFGRWVLSPDWLRVDRHTGALTVASGWPPRFSYDAIRVPLHLTWANLPAAAAIEAFNHYWTTGHATPPAWVDLRSQEVASYDAPQGFHAIAALTQRASVSSHPATFPTVATAKDYYSAGLILLSRLAAGEGGLIA